MLHEFCWFYGFYRFYRWLTQASEAQQLKATEPQEAARGSQSQPRGLSTNLSRRGRVRSRTLRDACVRAGFFIADAPGPARSAKAARAEARATATRPEAA